MPLFKILSLFFSSCFPLFIILFPITLTAHPDTTNLNYFTSISAIPFGNYTVRYDTLLENIHNYSVLTKNQFYFSQGNIGHAHFPLVFDYGYHPGFNYQVKSFDRYLFNSDSIQYGLPVTSMTDIYYIMGSKKEQSITVKHWQNIRKDLFGGVQVRMVNSPGLYKRQKSDIKNFTLHTNFLTNNKKYGFISHYIHNKIKVNENGGIVNDSIFEEDLETDRQLIDVRLSGASNFIKENIFFFRHYYSFIKATAKDDTIMSHPAGFFNPGQVSHAIRLNFSNEIYKDARADSMFYSSTWDKLNNTYDSIHTVQVENAFYWTNRKSNIQALVLDLGVKFQHTVLYQGLGDKKFDNLVYTGKISSSPSKKFLALADISFTNGTYFSNDMDAGFRTGLYTGKFTVEGEVRYAFFHVPYIFTSFESNHFRWNNDFNRTRNLSGDFNISGFGFKFRLRIATLDNSVYLDPDALPVQKSGSINYLMASVEKKMTLRHWVFKAKMVYQESSDEFVIPVPVYFTNMSIFYRNTLFDKACLLETGVEGYWFSPFYSPAYMPALRSFYMQDEKKTGGFIYPEIFTDLQIKRARIFLKYVNPVFNSMYNYYHIPHYPLQDGGFRFGLSWMFYN